MANVRYVDVDADAGGDGTTNALTGANCAYKSLSIWEAARQAVLSDVEECVCESSHANHTADTTAAVIDGWTTDATNYIYIHTSTAARHAGIWSTSKYRLSTEDYSISLDLLGFGNDGQIRIDGLQFSRGPANGGVPILRAYFKPAGNDIRISNCIFKDTSGGYSTLYGIYANGSSNTGQTATFRIWNNILYDFTGTTSHGIFCGRGTQYVYNNTIVNCKTGITGGGDSGTCIAKNNLLYSQGLSAAVAAGGTFGAGTDYNATDLSSMNYTVTGEGNTHDRLSQTFTFTNSAGDDYTLTSSDAGAKDFGVDLSADANLAFSDDVIGTARPQGSAWDIGFFEVVVATATTAISRIMRLFEGFRIKLLNGRIIIHQKQ